MPPVEDLSHHFSRLIVACFDVFCSDSVAVLGSAFFEFVDCSSQLFCRDLWDSRHFIGVVVLHIDAALIFILTDFLFRFLLFIVVLNLGDEHSLLCRFDSWDVPYTLKSSSIL